MSTIIFEDKFPSTSFSEYSLIEVKKREQREQEKKREREERATFSK